MRKNMIHPNILLPAASGLSADGGRLPENPSASTGPGRSSIDPL